jgi:hypothetical protein
LRPAVGVDDIGKAVAIDVEEVAHRILRLPRIV